MTDIHSILKNGELVITGRLIDASNATLLAECSFDDVKIKCIYKPVSGERPLWDFPDGNLANREYAAFLISELMEFNIVPLTILRDGPYGIGMVQEWIEIDESVDLAKFFSTDNPELRKMALFDAIINNTDRKIGHLLPREDGLLFGCDHGVTFHHEYKLRTVLWQWADKDLNSSELENLKTLLSKINSEAKEEIQLLITKTEFEALVQRVQDLIEGGKFPLPSPDWPAIPWPAF